jgi:DNA primase
LARRIPPELIDEIRTANDIVEVVSERMSIKKAGRNYKGLCPFHQEKTPSFNVSPERQIYHCFGCGAGGNVITFLIEYEKMGFLDAVDELARRAGISLKDRVGGAVREAEDDPIYRLNDMARRYFRRCFSEEPGAAAREYCRERGLGDDIVDAFEIGYAPPGWDGLIAAARAEKMQAEALEEAGLVVRRKDGGHYDRFRDRLIFPLLVRGGRVVGFGGRAFGDQEPKYLNSPETRVYRKSRFLYGLTEARATWTS